MKKKDLLPDKSQLPILNLDEELFERNNTAAAFHIIISGLIKNKEQRTEIMTRVRPDYLDIPFMRYLYEIATEDLKRSDEVDVNFIIESIPKFGPKVYGMKSNRRSLKGHYFTLAQILDFQPTPSQVSKAIEMVIDAAKSEQSRHDKGDV
jgi:replicative DNA helicase